MEFKTSLTDICATRKDEWSVKVLGRLESVSDLPAADAMYHNQCYINFKTLRDIPSMHRERERAKKPRRGRQLAVSAEEAFMKVVSYLEMNDDEQVTIQDLVKKMDDFAVEAGEGAQAYSVKHMKRKLVEHFQDKIVISEMYGVANVVTLRSTCSSILHDYFLSNDKDQDDEQKKKHLILTAAKLIKSEIKEIECSKKEYPKSSSIASEEENLEYLPDSLKILPRELFVGTNVELKLAAIGQALMQATRPRILLAPLQIGLGVQMDHHFGS